MWGIAAKNRNVTFDVEESWQAFVETLDRLLQKLYDLTKRENSLTLNIANEKMKYNKFDIMNTFTQKKTNCFRVGKKNEQNKSTLPIFCKEDQSKRYKVEEKQILQEDFNFQGPDMFTAQSI